MSEIKKTLVKIVNDPVLEKIDGIGKFNERMMDLLQSLLFLVEDNVFISNVVSGEVPADSIENM